jgi:hypothetical protein
MGNVYTVTTTSDNSDSGLTLSEAINDANGDPGSTIDFSLLGTDTYTLTGTLPQIAASVTIDGTNTDDGQSITLYGGGEHQGFYVYSGTVLIENLTLDDTAAIGQAGSPGKNSNTLYVDVTVGAGGGGGGGAGLGGGLLVGSQASITLNNVAFEADSASGGNGAYGGTTSIGLDSTGFGGSGGGFEGGAGGKGSQTKGAGGSAGGFGAGGGGGAGSSGTGGAGGAGGFGGGGGGGAAYRSGAGASGFGASPAGPGYSVGLGGGGLGAGGDIFVEQGATLTIDGGSLAAGTVSGGEGASVGLGRGIGDGLGSGIFLQGDQSVTFAPAANQTVTISGVIADQSGSGGTGNNAGSGSVIMDGAGTLVLAADNMPGSSSDPDHGGFTGGITIEAGTVDLTAAGAAGSGAITFDASGDPTLEFTPATAPTNPIENFGTGDNIQIDDFLETSAPTYANGLLTLTGTDSSNNPIPSFTLDIPGQTLSNFQVNVGSSDTVIDYVACYCAGTLIRTPCGNERVEKLQIGDEVMTASGAARPIKWIGRRSYLGRFVTGRKDILPICIKAGALDDNVPKRDLWISPNHAMYLDGVLIEAKDLVNGTSIVQAERADKVEYVHIELESHDVIIAEGALAETFIDDDSRFMFHNAHEYRVLYPAAATLLAQYCAPRLDGGYELETVRQRIALRSGLTSNEETMPGDLRGYVDRITPHVVEGWAQNVEHPEAPVCLDIYAGGRLIGQVLANRYRGDLKRAGIGSGAHSFLFWTLPRTVSATDQVEVRRSLDGKALPRPAQAKRVRKSIAA